MYTVERGEDVTRYAMGIYEEGGQSVGRETVSEMVVADKFADVTLAECGHPRVVAIHLPRLSHDLVMANLSDDDSSAQQI